MKGPNMFTYFKVFYGYTKGDVSLSIKSLKDTPNITDFSFNYYLLMIVNYDAFTIPLSFKNNEIIFGIDKYKYSEFINKKVISLGGDIIVNEGGVQDGADYINKSTGLVNGLIDEIVKIFNEETEFYKSRNLSNP